MAGSGLLALLDDIATILDDVAVLSKTAAQKTSGIVGDDLAVNAQGLVGIDPTREIPIVLKVARGSLINKAWLVPLALILPQVAIKPLLMLGGAFLCFEAVEKLLHKKSADDERHHQAMTAAIQKSAQSLADVEKEKISQAVKTDAILSAEIIAVALGIVATEPLITKAIVLAVIALGMTVAVYGFVACIIKLDDLGLYLSKAKTKAAQNGGKALLAAAPKIMKSLGVIGMAAMFLVGGQILSHGIPAIEHVIAALSESGSFYAGIAKIAVEMITGIVTGFLCLGLVTYTKAPVQKAVAKLKPLLKKR